MTGLLVYGSLMWDNALAAFDGEAARLEGWERAFVGEDIRRFGSPGSPCPRLGLVPGAGCRAVLFRIPRADRRRVLRNLKRREARPLARVAVARSGGSARPRCFLPARGERRWEGMDEVVEALRRAQGLVGTGAESVRTVIHAMELWGIEDRLLRAVWDEVGGWTAGRGARRRSA